MQPGDFRLGLRMQDEAPPRGPKTITTGPYMLSLCPEQKRSLPAQDVESPKTRNYGNRKRRRREEQNQLVATLDVLLPPEARCGGA
jgi:hypothetical protein